MAFSRQTATFVRPNDATQYTAGDLVANNTTAGSVIPMSFVSPKGGASIVRSVSLYHSDQDSTASTFHLAVSDSQRDLHETPQAHRDWNVNLLRPKEEWVVPVLSRRVEPDRPKPGATSGAKPSAGHARVEQNTVQNQPIPKPRPQRKA